MPSERSRDPCKRTNFKEFKIRDSVLLVKGGKPHKLANQYEGPYTIIKIVNDKDNVKIIINNNKAKIVYVNCLRISYIDQENYEKEIKKKNKKNMIYVCLYTIIL